MNFQNFCNFLQEYKVNTIATTYTFRLRRYRIKKNLIQLFDFRGSYAFDQSDGRLCGRVTLIRAHLIPRVAKETTWGQPVHFSAQYQAIYKGNVFIKACVGCLGGLFDCHGFQYSRRQMQHLMVPII